jgi:RNA polymerase sigma factor (TIGR02999 family)
MEDSLSGDLTRLLKEHRAGDPGAFGALVELAHEELEKMARQQLRKAPPGRTLDTVGLINEAYLRLHDESSIDWQSRAHFYGVMARAMRFVVVDHARRHGAGKRGGGARRVTLDSGLLAVGEEAELVLAVHQALEQLESFNARLARIVECRYFAGMNDEEIGAALELSPRTVQRDWLRAQAWLRRALEEDGPG